MRRPLGRENINQKYIKKVGKIKFKAYFCKRFERYIFFQISCFFIVYKQVIQRFLSKLIEFAVLNH